MAEASDTSPELGINGYQPREPFINLHNRAERWAILVCHRRAGKTVACVAELVLSALFTTKKDARYAYVAPQYNQAKDVAWMYVKRLTLDIPGVVYNESELRADLPNGSRIRLYGADNPDRLRGLYLDGIVLDEYADMRPSVWGAIVRPMLTDRKGWAVFIGTPKGHNEFYRKWVDAQPDPGWFKLSLRASTSGIVDDEELKDAARSMSEDQYEQEFECSFEAAILGAFYGKQMREAEDAGRMCEVPFNPDWPVHTAWDLGFRDDTSIWFYQVIAGEIRLLEYHGSSGQSVEFYGTLLQSKKYKYGKHWLPHDARAQTLAAAGKSIVQQLADYVPIESLQIVPDLSVQDGIQAVRLMLERCWWDRDKTGDGVESLKQYQREWDEEKKVFKDKPRHDWTSHAADAFRMLAVAWQAETPKRRDETPHFPVVGTNYGFQLAPLETLWKQVPRRSGRI